ncbi:hypothetical protein QA612_09755 [Evansella sp. AB-P1]|uniref:hypothetical protein n=1 Tax=Evansella sp. AB-P1 TaxID=3037653 RepID=UPI00241C19FA|nr:hypothetical protein [Evansella sp. AB-P1]MDG5787784.1 hypothetical protein [Evansella sp. AB-P1]
MFPQYERAQPQAIYYYTKKIRSMRDEFKKAEQNNNFLKMCYYRRTIELIRNKVERKYGVIID